MMTPSVKMTLRHVNLSIYEEFRHNFSQNFLSQGKILDAGK